MGNHAPFTAEQEERIRKIIREEQQERVAAREQFTNACRKAYQELELESRSDKAFSK